MSIHLSPSILAADTMQLGNAVTAVASAGAHSIHVDVMDGHYVANIAFSPKTIDDLRAITHLPLHAHLEVANTPQCIPLFESADLVIVQEDTVADLEAVITQIQNCGARVGVAVNPDRPVKRLAPWLAHLDLVLVMAVEPGFGGQPFRAAVLHKATWLWEERRRLNLHFDIGIDGGVGLQTVGPAAAAGVDCFVAGSAIFSQPFDSGVAAANLTRLGELAIEHSRDDA
ncbi:MAG: ribulose-phosphate 3-epimerase [Anaerolineales bacterium]|nr:ribulose-phosphate 3-epimerase [Anaerolineales bacterium]